MARNGSGTYSRVEGPYAFNTIIDQVEVNAELDDIATALTNSLTKNGETTATANQPMGTYRHTGVGNGVARTDYAAMGQVQDGTLNWVDGGGTADAITATYSPAITALVDGQICCVRATAANATTTPTFAPNGLTARTIVKTGGVALVAGDIAGDGHELILRYLLASTRWELINPAVNATTLALATTYAALAGSASQAFAASTLTSTGGAINGTLGATTPATAAVTTLSASGLITATGGQIKFPATAVPSSDVNTLDDYEEGTFTPTAVPGTSGTITLGTATGYYTKIGRIVHFSAYCATSSISSPVGTLEIRDLPYFTASTQTTAIHVYATGLAAGATTAIMGYIYSPGGTEIRAVISKFAAGSAGDLAGDVDASTTIMISGSYQT